jgi:hypothetical protein
MKLALVLGLAVGRNYLRYGSAAHSVEHLVTLPLFSSVRAHRKSTHNGSYAFVRGVSLAKLW